MTKVVAAAIALILTIDGVYIATRDDRDTGPAQPPAGLRTAGPLPAGAAVAVETFLANPVAILEPGTPDVAAFGDLRLAWVLVEFLRFHQHEPTGRRALRSLARLTGVRLAAAVPWVAYEELLLGWDVPAPPGFLDFKRRIYLLFDPRWEPFFDAGAGLDWRLVTWGGVAQDGIRSLDSPAPAGPDDVASIAGREPIIGLVVEGHARAYLVRALAAHELVNDRLGGRQVAVTYCTLCQSGIAYRRDLGEATVDLGTSGLLYASNKLMFDRHTSSLFHQFNGEAVTGPLARAGHILEPIEAVTTSWGQWVAAHPATSVVTGERYRSYEAAPPPAEVPRFPTAVADPRLAPRTMVLGVEAAPGVYVAFPMAEARRALAAGKKVTAAAVRLELVDGGLVARSQDTGQRLFGHTAFWFAWSFFHPGTALWSRPGRDR